MPHFVSLADPDDPRAAPYRDVRERDLAGRAGFMAEGEVVLEKLIRLSPHRPQSVLIAEKRRARLEPLLADLPDAVPVYVAAQPVLDAIAGFHLHRGILAVGERAPLPSPDALLAGLPERATVVVLHGLANHDNVGGVFRNAAAFGADAVLLDATSCDPLYRKAIRVSVGATLLVPWTRLQPGADPVALLSAHGFETIALSPSGQTVLSELRRPAKVAALFGTEGPGLPAEVLTRTRSVRIPMAGGFDSLNVAATSAVVLHHLAFDAG
ncbi:RNA methyltransferase [Caulobacter sp. 17J80-11]|uniref:TrmH family RNA methyltransferase n=1 Tax=Caulobacter sp. 17J80-11 TaxID=2763502 RepID=UPI001653BBF8|nr:RNA methyltransferase [Caulobacter sp. 17J80-11]